MFIVALSRTIFSTTILVLWALNQHVVAVVSSLLCMTNLILAMPLTRHPFVAVQTRSTAADEVLHGKPP